MSRLGTSDLGLTTMNDMRDNAAMIASIDHTVPVIADADTGYGGQHRFSKPPFSVGLTDTTRSSNGWWHDSRLVSRNHKDT
jgi:hypothetical protein